MTSTWSTSNLPVRSPARSEAWRVRVSRRRGSTRPARTCASIENRCRGEDAHVAPGASFERGLRLGGSGRTNVTSPRQVSVPRPPWRSSLSCEFMNAGRLPGRPWGPVDEL